MTPLQTSKSNASKKRVKDQHSNHVAERKSLNTLNKSKTAQLGCKSDLEPRKSAR